MYTEEELLLKTPAELVDLGICPTCFNREHGGSLYGDISDKLIFADSELECFFVGNPRAEGHACISSVEHYHDMSEAPDSLNERIVRFSAELMRAIKDIYGCERVYLCTMCDGPNNHYHVQLIPRYSYEKRGSKNFVKQRGEYVCDNEKLEAIRKRIRKYAEG